jgi:hypothetical protein
MDLIRLHLFYLDITPIHRIQEILINILYVTK